MLIGVPFFFFDQGLVKNIVMLLCETPVGMVIEKGEEISSLRLIQ